MTTRLEVTNDTFRLAEAFTISRGARTHAHVVRVTLERDGVSGQGECVPYARYGETLEGVAADIKAQKAAIEGGATRADIQALMPAGAARNAVDCAFWDLEAKLSGKPAWQLAGLSQPQPLVTAYTLSLGEPEAMEQKARANAHRPLLKVKLGGENDVARIRAVRKGAPDTKIIVDANEGWSVEQYQALAPEFSALGVAMVEQPFPADKDEALLGLERLLPVCADESCHDRQSLSHLVGKYDFINIKLDKTGGLTEAMALKQEAEDLGFGIMVGCMVGSSLAMAPATLVAQGATFVDLDAPLLLAEDRQVPLQFDGSVIVATPSALWG